MHLAHPDPHIRQLHLKGRLPGNQQPTGCMAAWQGCMWQPCFKKEPDSSANWLCLLEVYLWYAWFSSQTFRFITRNQCLLQSQKYDSHLLDMKLCRKHHFQSKFLPNSSRSSGSKRLTLQGQFEGSFPRKPDTKASTWTDVMGRSHWHHWQVVTSKGLKCAKP